LLELEGGEVAVDAKGPPVLVSWDGMVLENLPLLETGSREVAEGAKGPLVLVSLDG